MEIWRDIQGYEGLYQVSNEGRVRSLYHNKEHLLKPLKNNSGYLMVALCKGGERKVTTVHRLVAQTFVTNPNGFLEVNHKDENKENNREENLEWCSHSYNMNYGTRTEKTSKQVYQYSLDGTLIKIWSSTMECGRNGFNQGHVAECCRGERKKHYGYIWSYDA